MGLSVKHNILKRSLSVEGSPEKVRDSDRDSLHILPLSILPFETTALRHARMIKNARLESVIEFFSGASSGSGQMYVDETSAEFGWPQNSMHPDLVILEKLAKLPSYDVYSLRIMLRRHGITINDVEALKLSEEKRAELNKYMTDFTHPLIDQIFGSDDMDIKDFNDVLALFRNPDVRKAREKLEIMADKLGIKVEDVPSFLEDYADIFMSLSYYRQCLDTIEPVIDEFLESLDTIRANYQLKSDPNLIRTCNMMQATFNDLLASISGRFENFDKSTKDMWNNISAERFKEVERLIKNYHTTIGGVLCSLSVKMDAWSQLFPDKHSGGPVKRSEFILSEMKLGINKIKMIEDQAPMLASIETGK